ncbi:hypothetical protein ACFL04_04520 [Patescibacteria group bacterium]
MKTLLPGRDIDQAISFIPRRLSNDKKDILYYFPLKVVHLVLFKEFGSDDISFGGVDYEPAYNTPEIKGGTYSMKYQSDRPKDLWLKIVLDTKQDMYHGYRYQGRKLILESFAPLKNGKLDKYGWQIFYQNFTMAVEDI